MTILAVIGVGIDQDITAVTGLAAGYPRDDGVVFIFMSGAKIGIIGDVANDASASFATIDSLKGRF